MKKGSLFTTIGSVIILIICFIAFVISPTMFGNSGRDVITFGEYNGRKISYEQGSDFLANVGNISSAYQNYGYDPNQYNYQIFNAAFVQTVKQYALEDAVKTAGYEVPESSVNRTIRALPYLQKDGKFDAKLYNKLEQSQVADLKKSIKATLLNDRYNNDFFGTDTAFGTNTLYGLKISEAEKTFLAKYGEESRGFDMVEFKKSEYPVSEKVKYAEQNAAKFVTLDLAVITCKDKAAADSVLARIKNNEVTFEDAVSEYSNTMLSDTEGNLTNTLQYQVEDILTDKSYLAAIVDLPVDSVSDAYETSYGFSIFKKKSANKDADFSDEAMISKVSAYITQHQKDLVNNYFTAQAKDFATEVASTDFDKACEKFNLTKVTIAPFPLNFGSVSVTGSITPATDCLKNADRNEEFLKTAFSLKMNECSEPLILNDSIVIIQYTNNDEIQLEEEDIGIVKSQVSTIDYNMFDAEILDLSKVKNDFMSTYFSKMISNE